MSSMLCQGLQSCLEPRFVEPRGLEFSLAPPPKAFFSRPMEWAQKSCTSDSDSDIEEQSSDDNNSTNNDDQYNNNNNNNNNDDIDTNKSISGWSLVDAITNMSQSEANKQKEAPYVHPLVKRYSSKLSAKSLELCTENLGCETGTDISDFSDYSSTTSSDSENGRSSPLTRVRSKLRHNWGTNKKVNSGSFPPPLTSISGSNSVEVRPHREGGRLVIKTVKVQSPQTYFQAERCDGRLTLRFLKKFESSTLDSQFEEAVEDQNCDAIEQEQEQEPEQEFGNEDETELNQEIEIEDETKQDQEIDVEKDCFDEETEGNNGNVGGEIGIEKFQRPSRCKESGRGMLIWEPFWVAT